MSEQYAIASHNRLDTLKRKTLPLLKRLGVLPDQIDVWCNPDEVEHYQAGLDVRVRPVQGTDHDGPPCRVGAARNSIATAYPPGTRLLEFDDDVSEVAVGWKGRKLEPLDADKWSRTLDYAWEQCDLWNLGLWGPYPVFNHFFMKPRSTTDLRYVTGTLFGTLLRGDATELVVTDDKEDFERDMRHTLRDGGVLRIEWLTYATNYYGEPGGMQSYRTPELVEGGARRLAELFPGLCYYAGRVGKNGNAEVKLNPKGTGVTSPIPAPKWV